MTQSFPLHDAQVQMTLASIAYAGDQIDHANPREPQLRAAIKEQLYNRPKYATCGDWMPIWGPVETSGTDNLTYVAYNKSDHTVSVCLRGTTTQFLSRLEDIPTSQTAFPESNTSGATVSTEFLGALKKILTATDRFTKDTIAGTITTFADNNPVSRVTVNGHSQGAALTPMMALALQQGAFGSPAISLPVSGFAFAPPTSGNPGFAALVGQRLDCWFVVNPLDVVPLGYCCIGDVIKKGIPEPMKDTTWGHWAEVEAAVHAAEAAAALSGPWAQPAQRAILPKVPLTGDIWDLVGDQHNHNSYLCLLGAPQTDVGDPSPFPGCPVTNPVITT